jgi:hypothetical protein
LSNCTPKTRFTFANAPAYQPNSNPSQPNTHFQFNTKIQNPIKIERMGDISSTHPQFTSFIALSFAAAPRFFTSAEAFCWQKKVPLPPPRMLNRQICREKNTATTTAKSAICKSKASFERKSAN